MEISDCRRILTRMPLVWFVSTAIWRGTFLQGRGDGAVSRSTLLEKRPIVVVVD